MLRNLLKVAIRNILNNRIYSFINIVGLAIGMASCILILLWVTDELSFNGFHRNLDRIFLVPQTQHYQTIGDFTVMPTPFTLSQVLKDENPEIECSTRYEPWFGKRRVTFGDKSFEEQVNFADQSFFDIFSFEFVEGDGKTVLTDPNSIVLTQETAQRFFGNDNPIGKTVRMDEKVNLRVTGVIKNVPRNSDIRFEGLAPTALLAQYGYDLSQWGGNTIITFVLLKDSRQAKDLSKRIENVIRKATNGPTIGALFLFPFKDLHLYSIAGSGGRIRDVVVFSVIAFFILVIACINFMNLSTARSAKRVPEVGIRRVLGATRGQIAKQFFGESVLLAMMSLALALTLVEFLLPSFNQISGKVLRLEDMAASTSIFIVAITALTGMLAGIYPSLVLSSFLPLSILSKTKSGRHRQLSLRRLLVIAQFAVSIGLIVGSSVVYLQLKFMQNKDLGMDLTNVVCFSLDEKLQKSVTDLKAELLENTGIVSVTSASHIPTEIYTNGGGWSWEGMPPNQSALVSMTWTDYDYLKTFDMKVMDGRFYSKQYPADDSISIVINESFAKLMGDKSPVGKVLTYSGYHATIIGVVKDFNFVDLHSKIGPLVMLLRPQSAFLFVKESDKDPEETLAYIENTCKRLDPKFTINCRFLDKSYEEMYSSEQRLGRIFMSFAALAIIISCMGLFGLSSYVSELRTKEIGIRKVLGASMRDIVFLLSKEFTKWVLIANVLAWPVSYYFMHKWLEDFAYRIDIGLETFLLAGSISFTIALITVSYQAIKTALANPVDALRYE